MGRQAVVGVLLAACASGESESAALKDVPGLRPVNLDGITGWMESVGPPEAVTTARALLLRWWTDTCPYCERSLPALESLAEKYGDDGLVVVGVYHPKPRGRAFSEDDVLGIARGYGFHGPIALDPAWSLLREAWLDTGDRRATSVSLLIDRTGRVRHAHPGPELHPSGDPAHAECARGFEAMEQAVGDLLGV